ncbi:MAG: 5-formyltetrahydrofolate cyclo-ligase [Fusobacteriota bacterium]
MKENLRSILKQKRENLSEKYIKQKSEKIYRKIINYKGYAKSQVIMSYCDIKNEVKTDRINNKILQDGKRLVLPYIDRKKDIIIPIEIKDINNLNIGKYNILEPKHNKENVIDPSELDLVLVPAVGYDKYGNRIGFGGGYYDKFLCGVDAKKVGLAYDFQVVEKIKSEEHDIKIDKVIYTD